jgi:predicted CopG family antitoxin
MPMLPIYLTDDVYEKLRNVDNKSKVIQEALRMYFNLPPVEKKGKIEKQAKKEVKEKVKTEKKEGEKPEKVALVSELSTQS